MAREQHNSQTNTVTVVLVHHLLSACMALAQKVVPQRRHLRARSPSCRWCTLQEKQRNSGSRNLALFGARGREEGLDAC